jgi:acetylornithine deacetylase/succinyl-diaminopimelate desuccinylase-like protein
MRSVLILIATAAALTLPVNPAEVARPGFDLTTAEAFDPKRVGAYETSHPAIYRYIDENLDAHLAHLQRWVRQPSISALNEGIAEMAELLRQDLLDIGFAEAALVPTSGHPGVWGYYDAGADKTLAIYMMYDVQPVEPEDWQVDPFAGEIVDHDLGRALMARGATNQKGPQRAFLNAIESIIAVEGTLPVNLMVVAEGEEELGSPNYLEVIEPYRERLQTADGVLFPFNAQDQAGDVSMFLGVKGIVYFELEAKGGPEGGPTRAEIHGSLKAIADSPSLRLVQAIASLTDESGNVIVVPGYYDAIRGPTHEEQTLINASLEDYIRTEPLMMQALGLERLIDGMRGEEAALEYLYTTTLNINGIWAGYTGEGVKTILPHKATAKMDSRLVPDQDPDAALALIRSHLDERGFSDVIIRKMAGYPPAQTSLSAPLVQSAIRAYNKRGGRLSIAPRIGGSAPYYVFTDVLGLPLVAGGIGYGTGAHAPNEIMIIEPKEGSGIAGLAEIEKFYVDLLYALLE